LTTSNDDLKTKTEFMLDVMKRYDNYIATTNFKVGLMLSFLVTVIWGLTLHVKSVPVPTVGMTCTYNIIIGSVVTTIVISLIAIIHLLRAVSPNTSSPKHTKSLIFFGDVSAYEEGTDYYDEIMDTDTEKLANDLAVQTHAVAKIVSEKFRIIKLASNTIIFGVIPLVLCSLTLILILGD